MYLVFFSGVGGGGAGAKAPPEFVGSEKGTKREIETIYYSQLST